MFRSLIYPLIKNKNISLIKCTQQQFFPPVKINCCRNLYDNCNKLENKLDNYLKSVSSIRYLKKNLSLIEKDDDFVLVEKYLNTVKHSLKEHEINCLENIISKNINSINFNKYNYFKFSLLNSPLLDAYLIIWNSKAQTNIHTHPKNGCFILKLSGNWIETIFNSKKKYSRNLNENTIYFIDNSIGAHRVLYNKEKIGLSINIYSPGSLEEK